MRILAFILGLIILVGLTFYASAIADQSWPLSQAALMLVGFIICACLMLWGSEK
jgi:hypothetical protein